MILTSHFRFFFSCRSTKRLEGPQGAPRASGRTYAEDPQRDVEIPRRGRSRTLRQGVCAVCVCIAQLALPSLLCSSARKACPRNLISRITDMLIVYLFLPYKYGDALPIARLRCVVLSRLPARHPLSDLRTPKERGIETSARVRNPSAALPPPPKTRQKK